MISYPSCLLLRKVIGIGMMMLGGFAATSPAQTSEQALPVVIDGKMPIYPVMARCARIQGVVTVKVTTDGKKVTALGEGSGPPMLVKFVKENISTWEFLQHKLFHSPSPSTRSQNQCGRVENLRSCRGDQTAPLGRRVPLVPRIWGPGIRSTVPLTTHILIS
jgi:hypothetical protein